MFTGIALFISFKNFSFSFTTWLTVWHKRPCFRPIYIYIYFNYFYFWLCWVFVSVRGLSLAVARRGHSSLRCAGLPLSRPLLLRSTGSRAQAQQLWLTGLVAPRHVGSSQTRARTRVPCTGRQTLNHCATREALGLSFNPLFFFFF